MTHVICSSKTSFGSILKYFHRDSFLIAGLKIVEVAPVL